MNTKGTARVALFSYCWQVASIGEIICPLPFANLPFARAALFRPLLSLCAPIDLTLY